MEIQSPTGDIFGHNSLNEHGSQTNQMQLSETNDLRRRAFLGVDVGGTNTKFAVVGDCGSVFARELIPTRLIGNPQDACRRILEFAEEYSVQYRFEGVGVAVPGILDSRQGVLREVANLPNWTEFRLRDELVARSGLPVVVVNDANAAAHAEHAFRELDTGTSLALVTLGTGVGCGVAIGDKTLAGDHGCGGELGHAMIDVSSDARMCGCGKPGHLEAYAGAAAVAQRAKDKLLSGAKSSVAKRLHLEGLNPQVIAEEAERGDALCRSVVQETATYVGLGVSLLCQIIDPSVVLLGGAMTFGGTKTETGRGFLSCVRQTVCRSTLEEVGGNVVIEFASLGNDAGALGAAILVHHAAGQDSYDGLPSPSKTVNLSATALERHGTNTHS
jgi:glucokinase